METNSEYRRRRIWDIILKVLLVLFLLLLIFCLLKIFLDCRDADCDCRQHQRTRVDDTGYLPDNEDWEVIPDTIPPYDDNDFDSLPAAVSLEAFFPPIGNQETYGTCVAWSTGYNLTTALNAIQNHWTPDDLEDPANQTSPKDLWMGIPSQDKGQFCTGTAFEKAFAVLTSTGAEHMDKVPYKNMGNCDEPYFGDATNTLTSYYHIVSGSPSSTTPSGQEIPSVNQIKAYLNDTIPLVFAAAVGLRFQGWASNGVYSYSSGYDLLDGCHAMVISGYDDAKNAFRIRNSWGEEWGDEGSAWVDYDFFMNKFCIEVFMAEK